VTTGMICQKPRRKYSPILSKPETFTSPVVESITDEDLYAFARMDQHEPNVTIADVLESRDMNTDLNGFIHNIDRWFRYGSFSSLENRL